MVNRTNHPGGYHGEYPSPMLKPRDIPANVEAVLVDAIARGDCAVNDIKTLYVMAVFIRCNQSMSETARRIKMPRRTLQRMLDKRLSIETRKLFQNV